MSSSDKPIGQRRPDGPEANVWFTADVIRSIERRSAGVCSVGLWLVARLRWRSGAVAVHRQMAYLPGARPVPRARASTVTRSRAPVLVKIDLRWS